METLVVRYPEWMRFGVKHEIIQTNFIMIAKNEIEVFEGLGQPKALRK
jgi:hypothetical protein